MQNIIAILACLLSFLLGPSTAQAEKTTSVCDTSYFNAQICPGQGYFIAGTFFDLQNPSGMVTLSGACWDGSDSVIVVNLSPALPVTHLIQRTLCDNEALFIDGQIFDPTHPSGTILYPGAAQGGCDSLLRIELIYLSTTDSTLQETICANDTVWVNGQAYDQYYYRGMETIVGGNAQGCDSIILVDLIVLPLAVDSISLTICPGQTLEVNGTLYHKNRLNGIEILPGAAQNGCDSIIVVSLSLHDAPPSGFLGEDSYGAPGDSICFDLSSLLSFDQISWAPQPACLTPDCSHACFVLWQSGEIAVSLTDQNGCSYTDNLRIQVSDERPVYVPNTFAPDADAPNNSFHVFSSIQGSRIKWLHIYDRWGGLVWEEKNILPGNPVWNGQINGREKGNTEVYIYAFEIQYPDGKQMVHRGNVTVVR